MQSEIDPERRQTMELPWLMKQIEMHAEQLTHRVIEAVRTSPRTKFLRDVSEEELRRRFFDLFRNLGRWLSEGETRSRRSMARSAGALP